MELVVSLYILSLLPFSIVGVYRVVMLVRLASVARRAPAVPAPGTGDTPFVTVQLPLFNERYVARRLIGRAAALTYPRERYEIQILDDSTDDTPDIVRRAVAELPGDVSVSHVRRRRREGYKAGALAAGLERARGELIAIFDADFVPEPDFLARVVPHFSDAGVGMVQCRWGYLNEAYSFLTRAEAGLLDAHFQIEHVVRSRTGSFFNFNGTAGIFRRRTIEDAGGWRSDTLTEDLDLSYRAQLAGWRFVYRHDVVVPSELPVDIRGFKRQQYRWSKGMTEAARAILPALWRSNAPFRVKLEGTFHLLSNAGYVFVCLMSLTLVPTFFHYGPVLRTELWALALSVYFTMTNLVAIAAFVVVASYRANGRWDLAFSRAAAVLPVGVGIAVTGAMGVISAFFGRRSPFERTPKLDVVGRRRSGAHAYGIPTGRTTWVEALFALYHVVWIGVIFASGRLDLLVLSAIFFPGYLYIVVLEAASARSARRYAASSARSPVASAHVVRKRAKPTSMQSSEISS